MFNDIYVARSTVGETFWQIAQDGLRQFSHSLFRADRQTRAKYPNHQPFQVYACWNVGAVISANAMERWIKFRRNEEGKCYMGEPKLFAKDLWRLGLGGYKSFRRLMWVMMIGQKKLRICTVALKIIWI